MDDITELNKLFYQNDILILMTENTSQPSYFIRNINVVIGLVLVWRGVWHGLDILETMIGIDHTLLAAGIGFVIGLILLYAPDHDLKELQKL